MKGKTVLDVIKNLAPVVITCGGVMFVLFFVLGRFGSRYSNTALNSQIVEPVRAINTIKTSDVTHPSNVITNVRWFLYT
jgi:hypothetical protein